MPRRGTGMAQISFERSEIEVKIVYYGPAFSGKTTNVEVLYSLVPARQRGELHSLKTDQDRTLFFDYVPVELGEIAGFKARFQLFTVPGQVYYKETRRVVLQGADAVVFVADSSPERAQANLDALVDLEENLQAHGFDLASIPLVLQLNKRDAPDAMDADAMASDLNPFGVPVIEAVAAQGRGVLDTLRRVIDIASQRIRENLQGQDNALTVTMDDRAEREADRDVIREQLDKIQEVRARETAHVQRLQAAGWISHEDVNAFLTDNAVRGEVTPIQPVPPPPVEDPTPVRRPEAAPLPAYPGGPPLEAWITGPPAVVREVRSASIGADGRARLEVVLDVGGQSRLHALTLTPKPPDTAPPRWVTATSAATIAGGLGILLGMAFGWFFATLAGG